MPESGNQVLAAAVQRPKGGPMIERTLIALTEYSPWAAAVFVVVFYFLRNSSISIKYPRKKKDKER